MIASTCPVCDRDDAKSEKIIAGELRVSCPRCGEFSIEFKAIEVIKRQLSDQRHRLAYGVRAASEQTEHLLVTADTVLQYASMAPRWNTMDEAVERFLVAIAPRAKAYTQQLEIEPKTDYVRVPVRSESEFSDLYNLAHDMEYFDSNTHASPCKAGAN